LVRETLLQRLRAEGFKVWNVDSIPFGATLVPPTALAVEQSRYVLAVVSPAYLQSDFRELEAVLAAQFGLEQAQRRLLVVTREPVRLPLKEVRPFG
jgi:hypothetical protein